MDDEKKKEPFRLLSQIIASPPEDENKKYIFLLPFGAKQRTQAVRRCGFWAIQIEKAKDKDKQTEFDEDARNCTKILWAALLNNKNCFDYVFVIACFDQGALLKNFFEENGFKYRDDGWKIFQKLPKDNSEDTCRIIDGRIKAFIALAQEQWAEATRTVDLERFHTRDQSGNLRGVFHDAIYQHIKREYNLFVMGGTVYIYDNGVYKPDSSGARLKTLIRSFIYPQFIKSTTINNIFALFLMDSELEKTFDEINNYPAYWINFQNGFYDPKEKKMVMHSPEYLSINQLPHEFEPSAKLEGKAIEEWLCFIAPEADSREMILQFAGYCLGRDVGQQKFMILNGEGGSGKSTLIRLIESMVGSENISNIALSELQTRFASFGLMGKLLNSCADLEIAALEDTSVLKKSLGEDRLRGEQKGHDAISFRSYAKMIFSTNELPTVRSERTNGFYRRLLIMPMNRTPTHNRADFFDSLNNEIDYFIHITVEALERMYETGLITESKLSIEAIQQMKMDSDSVEAWLQEQTYRVPGSKINRAELYQRYNTYCVENERQSLSRTNFFKALRSKGFSERKSNGINYIEGISLENPSLKASLFVPAKKEEQLEIPF